MTTIIDTLDQEQIAKLSAKTPEFAPGDTLRVNVKVIEGTRERVQAFEGVCIARKNAGRELELHRAQDLLWRRAWSACSRSTARASPRSRWCAAAMSAGPSSITCAAGAARRRASPRRPGLVRRRREAETAAVEKE